MTVPWTQPPKVAVVGGGLAGLAAASALADSGFRVSLFERRPYLGGRASSYEHPGTGEVVDNCQHVLLGCCTNLIEFYRRMGVEDKIRWYDHLTFLELGPSLDDRAIVFARAFAHRPGFSARRLLEPAGQALHCSRPRGAGSRDPARPRRIVSAWLRRHGQTEQAIQRFWKTVLVSALNEDLDCVSVPYAAQVVRESFLKSLTAGRMGVPRVPLSELYGTAGDYVQKRGGEVRLRAGVRFFRADPSGVRLELAANEESKFDFVVLAVPFDVLAAMLPETSTTDPLRRALNHFEPRDHGNPSLVRPPDYGSGPCRSAGSHHPVDVPQIEVAGDNAARR